MAVWKQPTENPLFRWSGSSVLRLVWERLSLLCAPGSGDTVPHIGGHQCLSHLSSLFRDFGQHCKTLIVFSNSIHVFHITHPVMARQYVVRCSCIMSHRTSFKIIIISQCYSTRYSHLNGMVTALPSGRLASAVVLYRTRRWIVIQFARPTTSMRNADAARLLTTLDKVG